jgi:hypothetical protein
VIENTQFVGYKYNKRISENCDPEMKDDHNDQNERAITP